jgi:hypothetical protein
MRANENSRAGEAGGRRSKGGGLYRIIVNGVIELGEVARIEIEILKLFPPASAQPRCPFWHKDPGISWPVSAPGFPEAGGPVGERLEAPRGRAFRGPSSAPLSAKGKDRDQQGRKPH